MSTPELFTEPQHVRGDLQSVAQAVRKGWKIPEVVFEKAGVVIAFSFTTLYGITFTQSFRII